MLRQSCRKLAGDQQSVDHRILCGTGMDARAADGEFGLGRIEVVVGQISDRSAIDRVGEVSREMVHIEQFRPASSQFFVGSESEADLPVLPFRMCEELLAGGHDGRNASFVVGAQQGCAICSDDRLPDIVAQAREFLRRKDDLLGLVQDDVTAIISRVDLRTDINRVEIGRVQLCAMKPMTGTASAVLLGRVAVRSRLFHCIRPHPNRLQSILSPIPGRMSLGYAWTAPCSCCRPSACRPLRMR